MRSRLAIVVMLASGILLTGGGAALGASALLTDLTAGAAQYGEGAPPSSEQPPTQVPEQLPVQRLGPATPQQPAVVVQAQRQILLPVGGQLPFTGYATIALLLVGIALLASGLALRAARPRIAA